MTNGKGTHSFYKACSSLARDIRLGVSFWIVIMPSSSLRVLRILVSYSSNHS